MSNFLLILGLIFLVGFPIYSHLYCYQKIQKFKDPRVFYFFSLIPGVIFISSGMYFSPVDTFIKSEKCGVVEQYKTFQKRKGHFERLAIVMDQSGYIRILTSMKLYPVFKLTNIFALNCTTVLKIKA